MHNTIKMPVINGFGGQYSVSHHFGVANKDRCDFVIYDGLAFASKVTTVPS